MDLSVPVIITENLDLLNTSSGYYNDICYTATSDTGTDIPLNGVTFKLYKYNESNDTWTDTGKSFTTGETKTLPGTAIQPVMVKH